METRGERSIKDVADGLGIKLSEAMRKGRGEAPEDELKRLRRENARPKREREILAKAAVFFAKESAANGKHDVSIWRFCNSKS